jgi:AAA15 family ATPase/GTPase
MKVIEEIFIDRFRSCRQTRVKDFGEFSIIAGRNNTGKSNILRALCLFFIDEIEPGVNLDLKRDCNAASKEKRRITIEVKFCLDPNIKIQQTIKEVMNLVPRDGRIKKEYEADPLSAKGYKTNYYINGNKVNDINMSKIDKFINLFTFRYITANRTPSAVLEENLVELRAELKFKLNSTLRHQKEEKENLEDLQKHALSIIKNIALDLFTPIKDEIIKADKNIADVNIQTPDDITELVNTTVYQLTTSSGTILSEKLQGQGIQNILLFAVLYLVDKNFHRKFGWKIATIWAVEEPEIFLHFDLENQLANYFNSISSKEGERFQILCTSHSNVFPQYADSHHMLKTIQTAKGPTERFWTKSINYPPHDFLIKLTEEKIANCLSLITAYPHQKIILLEGPIDEYIFTQLIQREGIENTLAFSIQRFLSDKQLKGDSQLLAFLKANLHILKNRALNYGVYAIFDWESDKPPINSLSKNVSPPNVIYQFDNNDANPLLDKSFHGIERYYPTNIIQMAMSSQTGIISDRGENKTKDRYYADIARYELVKDTLFNIIKSEKEFSLEYFKKVIGKIKS